MRLLGRNGGQPSGGNSEVGESSDKRLHNGRVGNGAALSSPSGEARASDVPGPGSTHPGKAFGTAYCGGGSHGRQPPPPPPPPQREKLPTPPPPPAKPERQAMSLPVSEYEENLERRPQEHLEIRGRIAEHPAKAGHSGEDGGSDDMKVSVAAPQQKLASLQDAELSPSRSFPRENLFLDDSPMSRAYSATTSMFDWVESSLLDTPDVGYHDAGSDVLPRPQSQPLATLAPGVSIPPMFASIWGAPTGRETTTSASWGNFKIDGEDPWAPLPKSSEGGVSGSCKALWPLTPCKSEAPQRESPPESASQPQTVPSAASKNRRCKNRERKVDGVDGNVGEDPWDMPPKGSNGLAPVGGDLPEFFRDSAAPPFLDHMLEGFESSPQHLPPPPPPPRRADANGGDGGGVRNGDVGRGSNSTASTAKVAPSSAGGSGGSGRLKRNGRDRHTGKVRSSAAATNVNGDGARHIAQSIIGNGWQ